MRCAVLLLCAAVLLAPAAAVDCGAHGTATGQSCVCQPGWQGQLCDDVKAVASCAAWQALLGKAATDNEYIITVGSRRAVVWCAFMNTTTPKEYITLRSHLGNNYADRYKWQLPSTASGCTSPALVTTAWDSWGHTSFLRIRLVPSTMTIDTKDFSFAINTNLSPVPLGTAEDCFGNSQRSCGVYGEAVIDLSYTPFIIASKPSDWKSTASSGDVVINVTISSDQRAATIFCGGASTCGGCAISTLKVDFDDASTGACSSNPCQNNATCVENEGGFVCVCPPEFTGQLCDIGCTDTGCDTAGVCDNNGIFGDLSGFCYCPQPWIGPECEEYDYCNAIAETNGGLACERGATCENIVFDVVETASGACAFPFLYNGINYYTCVDEPYSAPWCSLTHNYDKDGQRGTCLVHATKPVPVPGLNPPPPPPPPPPNAPCVTAAEYTQAVMSCADRRHQVISDVVFASYGAPSGTCNDNYNAWNKDSIVGNYMPGSDFAGNDMAPCNGGGCLMNTSTTPDTCEALCRQTTGCVGFVWAPAGCGGQSANNNRCWLKSIFGVISKNTCRNSKMIVDYQAGVDYAGNDMAPCNGGGCAMNLSSTVSDCEALCLRTANCAGYVWAPAGCGNQSPANNRCWLKGAFGQSTRNACRNTKILHCHSARSLDEVEKRCLGKTTCTIDVSNTIFGDPCWGIVKNLTVQWKCDFEPDQWVNVSLAEIVDRYNTDPDTIITKTVVNSCDNGDGPRANINKGLITFDDFSAADCRDPTKVGVVRVDITLPFMFTQVRGTIFARSPQGNEYLAIRDNNDCDLTTCTAGDPWGHGVGGVLFGTDSALIKRGGDWGNVQGSANFTFPATVSLPTNVLRFEVSDISDRMALEIFDFQLQLLVPVEDKLKSDVVHYNFDEPYDTSKLNLLASYIAPSVTPTYAATGLPATCQSAPSSYITVPSMLCPSWTRYGFVGGSLDFEASKTQALSLSAYVAYIFTPAAWTITIWVKPSFLNCDSNGAHCTNQPVLIFNYMTGLYISGIDRVPAFRLPSGAEVRASEPVPENEWSFLSVGFNPTTLSFYLGVNGQQTRTTFSTNPGLYYYLMYLGVWRSPNAVYYYTYEYFNGQMDELVFFTRVLSSAELLELAGQDNAYVSQTKLDFEQNLESDVGLAQPVCRNAGSCPVYSNTSRVTGDYSANFTGASCVKIGAAVLTGIAVDGTWSLSLWLRPWSLTLGATVVSFDAATPLELRIESSTLVYRYGSNSFVYALSSLNLNTWNHVGLRVNAATQQVTIFLNGVGETHAFADVDSGLSSTTAIYLGCSNTGQPYYLSSAVDDFELYDLAVSDYGFYHLARAIVPPTVPAASLNCDFDEENCDWNSDSWIRWRGISPALNEGPLEDAGTQHHQDKRIYCAATNHFYEVVSSATPIDLPTARAEAESLGGYLATITSAGEQACVAALTKSMAWLGAAKDDAAAPNTWIWIGDDDAKNKKLEGAYTNWASNLPTPTAQPWLMINYPTYPAGKWADCNKACGITNYIVEYAFGTTQLYQSDFSNGVDGWNSTVRTMRTSKCGRFGYLLGGAGIFGGKNSVNKTFNNLPQHKGVRIDVGLVAIDAFQPNDYIWIRVDSVQVWTWYPATDPSRWLDSTDECGSGASSEQVRMPNLLLPNHSASKLALQIGCSLAQGTAVQSIGVMDVAVYLDFNMQSAPCRDNGDFEPCYLYTRVNTTDSTVSQVSSPYITAPAMPSQCSLQFAYNMRGERWYSHQNCSTLGWPVATEVAKGQGPGGYKVPASYANVCASAQPQGICVDYVTYQEAVATCQAGGARLCNYGELTNNVGVTGGCNHVNYRLWTGSQCDEDAVITMGGIDESIGVECVSIHNTTANIKLMCCADVSPPANQSSLHLRVHQHGAAGSQTVWSVSGGSGPSWVEAKVNLGLTSSEIPYTLTFEATAAAAGVSNSNGYDIMALDEIRFVNCDPPTNVTGNSSTTAPIDEIVYSVVDDGKIVDAVASSDWSGAPISPHASGNLLYVANQNTGRLSTTDAKAATAKLNLGVNDFDASITATVSTKGNVQLILDGGMWDGYIGVAPSGVTFSGTMFGGATSTVSLPHPLQSDSSVSLLLQRRDDTLTLYLEDQAIKATRIGVTTQLQYLSLGTYVGGSVSSFAVAFVVAKAPSGPTPPPPPGGAPRANNTKVVDIPLAKTTDDLYEVKAGGAVSWTSSSLDFTLLANQTDPAVFALRFANLPLLATDTVTKAYIQFTATETSGNGFEPFIISIHNSIFSSADFVADQYVTPCKVIDASSGSTACAYLSSNYSSQEACQIGGGTYNNGYRADYTMTVSVLWVNGVLQRYNPPVTKSYIAYVYCSGFTPRPFALTNRPKLVSPVVSWTPDMWMANARGDAQRTPDLSSLLNTIKQTYYLNSATFFITSNALTKYAVRKAYSYDGAVAAKTPLYIPTLHLEYAPTTSVDTPVLQEALCRLPFYFNNKWYYSCTAETNPRQKFGEVSTPWCATDTYYPNANSFGFCSSHVIGVTGGNAGSNAFCAFPFTYQGKTYLDCIDATDGGRNGEPWCATTEDYDQDGKWGYCIIPTAGGTGGGAPCVFPFYFQGRKYEECTTDGARSTDTNLPWCVVETTTAENYAGAKWGFCSNGANTAKTWNYQCHCPAGFTGQRCENACPSGFYGDGCLSRCNCTSGHGACDPISGACLCNPGWYGDNCESASPSTVPRTTHTTHTTTSGTGPTEPPTTSFTTSTAGTTATTSSTFPCSLCRHITAVCHSYDTQCACEAGWQPPFCIEACPKGSYGLNCAHSCDCNGVGLGCSPVDGTCDCPAGYYNTKCDPCPANYYGLGCAQQCTCHNNATCDSVSGTCTCKAGWYGDNCAVPASTVDASKLFINEFQYPNGYNVKGSAVEIAAPAGESLTGWKLEIYDGRAGSGTLVGTIALNFVVANFQNGMGVKQVDLGGVVLPSGSGTGGAGFALVSPAGKVTMLLSYGSGTFVAAEGSAKGLRSVAVGVSETSSAASGSSVQLVGAGSSYTDFAWSKTLPTASFGSVNTGQRFTDTVVEETIAVALQLGKGVADSRLQPLVTDGEALRAIKPKVLTALQPLGVTAADMLSFSVVLASGSNGLAVYFTLQARVLPSTDDIESHLRLVNSYDLNGHMIVKLNSVYFGSACIPGTEADDSGVCVTSSTPSTSSTKTTPTTTQTTRPGVVTDFESSTSSSSYPWWWTKAPTTAPGSTPCVLTTYGCCPDDVTAAQGPDHAGCPGTDPVVVPKKQGNATGVLAGILLVAFLVAFAILGYVYLRRKRLRLLASIRPNISVRADQIMDDLELDDAELDDLTDEEEDGKASARQAVNLSRGQAKSGNDEDMLDGGGD